jgi:hypothetical protein
VRGPFSRPTGIAILIAVVALSIGLPGLGASGFWSEAELPVFDRTRAALGHALSGLERTPWLPDVVRTRS